MPIAYRAKSQFDALCESKFVATNRGEWPNHPADGASCVICVKPVSSVIGCYVTCFRFEIDPVHYTLPTGGGVDYDGGGSIVLPQGRVFPPPSNMPELADEFTNGTFCGAGFIDDFCVYGWGGDSAGYWASSSGDMTTFLWIRKARSQALMRVDIKKTTVSIYGGTSMSGWYVCFDFDASGGLFTLSDLNDSTVCAALNASAASWETNSAINPALGAGGTPASPATWPSTIKVMGVGCP